MDSLTQSRDVNSYSQELYARGYIFRSDKAPEAPSHWKNGSFGGFHFAYDPRLNAVRVKRNGCDLLALGVIFDSRFPDEGCDVFLERIAAELEKSHDAMHELLDHSSGRYVLAYTDPLGKSSIVSDATGMKSVFYYDAHPRMIVSHPYLILDNSSAGMRDKIAVKFGYPGLRGPVNNSFMLTPNACLDFETFTSRRVWPRDVVPQRSVDDAAKIIQENMANTIRFAKNNYQVLVSVTAGLDSRLTLSFLKDAKDVQYFTYYRSDKLDTDSHDLRFAKDIADDMELDVTVLRLSEPPTTPSSFRSILDRNTFLEHQKRLSWVYYHRYGNKHNLMHLRSNISEVGREFWSYKNFDVRSGRDLARLYLRGDKEYRADYVFRVIEAFEEFDRISGLTSCKDMIDIKSLFYWEFRMASWHAQLVAESDPAFDTLSIFNCRATLEAMLSVPRPKRKSSAILRHVISENWPALAEYDVNGKPFWPNPA